MDRLNKNFCLTGPLVLAVVCLLGQPLLAGDFPFVPLVPGMKSEPRIQVPEPSLPPDPSQLPQVVYPRQVYRQPPSSPIPTEQLEEETSEPADWDVMLNRLERAEQRLARFETMVMYNSTGANPSDLTPDDVDEYSPEYMKAFRLALEESLRTKPSANLTGQLQVDNVIFNQTDRNREIFGDKENATGFRRSRLGVFGELYETTEYRIEYDFAGNGRPRFLDNWIAFKTLPLINNVIIGHFFEPFSLERYTPNRFITFMERSAIDAFAPARNTGAMVFGHRQDENVTWAVGVFRSNSDTYGDSVNDSSDFAVTSHLTWLPFYDNNCAWPYLLHLGASHSYRASGDKTVRFRTRPENELQAYNDNNFPIFVDTGDINADAYNIVGLESALVYGPFSVQSEAILAHVNRLDGADPTFYGWYAYGSYFLTGEHRSYSRTSILGRFREGIFQRLEPRTNAFKGNVDVGNPRGIGAWEVAARYSYIDLNSGDIEGNSMGTLTLALNWYPNPNTRVQFNYVRPNITDLSEGRSQADIFGMRVGFEF